MDYLLHVAVSGQCMHIQNSILTGAGQKYAHEEKKLCPHGFSTALKIHKDNVATVCGLHQVSDGQIRTSTVIYNY